VGGGEAHEILLSSNCLERAREEVMPRPRRMLLPRPRATLPPVLRTHSTLAGRKVSNVIQNTVQFRIHPPVGSAHTAHAHAHATHEVS
jgi:hypothetical protein